MKMCVILMYSTQNLNVKKFFTLLFMFGFVAIRLSQYTTFRDKILLLDVKQFISFLGKNPV